MRYSRAVLATIASLLLAATLSGMSVSEANHQEAQRILVRLKPGPYAEAHGLIPSGGDVVLERKEDAWTFVLSVLGAEPASEYTAYLSPTGKENIPLCSFRTDSAGAAMCEGSIEFDEVFAIGVFAEGVLGTETLFLFAITQIVGHFEFIGPATATPTVTTTPTLTIPPTTPGPSATPANITLPGTGSGRPAHAGSPITATLLLALTGAILIGAGTAGRVPRRG